MLQGCIFNDAIYSQICSSSNTKNIVVEIVLFSVLLDHLRGWLGALLHVHHLVAVQIQISWRLVPVHFVTIELENVQIDVQALFLAKDFENIGEFFVLFCTKKKKLILIERSYTKYVVFW